MSAAIDTKCYIELVGRVLELVGPEAVVFNLVNLLHWKQLGLVWFILLFGILTEWGDRVCAW